MTATQTPPPSRRAPEPPSGGADLFAGASGVAVGAAARRFDPFADLIDEPDPGPAAARDQLLDQARRGYVPLRKILVQRPSTETERAAAIATIVRGRHHRPLDALLLVHALQPILPGSPLDLRTWARLLSTRTPCTAAAASRAFETLEELHLIRRSGTDRTPIVEPLHEDASRKPWTKAGLVKEQGPGYLTLPHAYWAGGYADQLTLPGKAMLLIILAETQDPKKPRFAMPVERAKDWYGLSERTAERGYGELSKAKLLLVHRTKVADVRHPAGRRDVYWRALASPFGTDDRARLQAAAKTAVDKRTSAATRSEQDSAAAARSGQDPS